MGSEQSGEGRGTEVAAAPPTCSPHTFGPHHCLQPQVNPNEPPEPQGAGSRAQIWQPSCPSTGEALQGKVFLEH